MKKKPLPIGIDNFEKLITRGYYFVDKTMLIKDLLDNKADVNLFTRPRRFGKTLNMSMLQYFFEDERNEFDGSKKDNKYLFDGLNIMNEGEEYTSYMGKYPVINLSLKSAKQPTLDLAFQCLREEISNEFRRHAFILKDERLSTEKEEYMNIVQKSDDMSSYATALRFLSQCLEKYYGKKTIILIDEYDVPLENAFFEGFYEKMIKFIRSLFESSLKTNASLEFAVITGCLRISKESIFTGLNNLEIISILNKSYDEYFGFTPKEVEKICSDYNIENKYELIKEWYNGYIFGDANVYNPWSVVRFVKDLGFDINEYPSSYWANTSSNSIVKSLIDRADDETKKEIELLIETISFNDAYENFYHGFVTGILSGMKGYTVKSNRESGNGRGDIFIRPVTRRKAAIILELKVCKSFNELEKRADDALRQIEEKKYEMELKDDGYNNVIKYGISFFKKDCLVKIKEHQSN